MSAFAYRRGQLWAEDVAVAEIAAAVGTPFYCYASASIELAYGAFVTAFAGQPARVCYALKANSNLAVVRTLAELGAGADVVSEGELRRALAAGVRPERIVFSGVGKSADELRLALAKGIGQINVESEPELAQLSALAAAAGATATIAIRVNPDVDAHTHDKITTGRRGHKFGIDIDRAPEVFARAAALPGIDATGIAVHIGSQLTDLAPYRAAFTHVAALAERLRAAGHAIGHLDLGGGLGIAYRDEAPPAPAAYAALVAETVGHLGCRLTIEPGRAIVGAAGVVVARVLCVKQGGARTFVIVDAAMNDLVRPTLYNAWHHIRPVVEPPANVTLAPADVAGPVCETGDTFATDRMLPPLAADQLVVFDDAGAYGAVMASGYNSRPLIPEVLVREDSYAVVRPRQSYDDMLAQDRMPPWLERKQAQRGVV